MNIAFAGQWLKSVEKGAVINDHHTAERSIRCIFEQSVDRIRIRWALHLDWQVDATDIRHWYADRDTKKTALKIG